jgi:hypothetical protein
VELKLTVWNADVPTPSMPAVCDDTPVPTASFVPRAVFQSSATDVPASSTAIVE